MRSGRPGAHLGAGPLVEEGEDALPGGRHGQPLCSRRLARLLLGSERHVGDLLAAQQPAHACAVPAPCPDVWTQPWLAPALCALSVLYLLGFKSKVHLNQEGGLARALASVPSSLAPSLTHCRLAHHAVHCRLLTRAAVTRASCSLERVHAAPRLRSGNAADAPYAAHALGPRNRAELPAPSAAELAAAGRAAAPGAGRRGGGRAAAMRWLACSGTAFQSPPPARMGHVALAITWGGGEELLLIHAGLSEEKYALADLAVLQTATEAWFYPEAPAGPAVRPPARAFHCGAVLGRRAYVFGGHVWVKEKRGLQKFNDLWCLDTVRASAPARARPNPAPTPKLPYTWRAPAQPSLPDTKGSASRGARQARRRADRAGGAQDSWAWSQLAAGAPAPAPRDFAGMVDRPDGRLLLFGGLDAAERRLDDTWVFDPAACAPACGRRMLAGRRTPRRAQAGAGPAGAPGRSSRWSGTRARGTRTRSRAWPTGCSSSAARAMQARARPRRRHRPASSAAGSASIQRRPGPMEVGRACFRTGQARPRLARAQVQWSSGAPDSGQAGLRGAAPVSPGCARRRGRAGGVHRAACNAWHARRRRPEARRPGGRPVDAARPGRGRRRGQLDPAGAAGRAAVRAQGRRHGRSGRRACEQALS